jgi:YegS/Rv2252/BmrU family lipid kinase
MSGRRLPKQAILIVNTASRSGADGFEPARDKLVAAGIELLDARAVEKPEALPDEVRGAIERAPMVIVGGGDGTLSQTVDHFLGTDTVFALLPLGTANSFARTLEIPLDLDGAVAVIASGVRKRIDLGEIDGDYFVNTASIGLSPMVAQSVPMGLKRVLGRVGYLAWAVRCAFKFRPFRLTIKERDVRYRFWATEVRIANGGHFGGVELVETAELDSGQIVIEAVTGKSLARLAWTWLAALARLPRGETSSLELRGREFRVDTRPRRRVSIDGELSKKTPITVRVARAAVEVAAPRAEPP